jgi:hypothetical protein
MLLDDDPENDPRADRRAERETGGDERYAPPSRRRGWELGVQIEVETVVSLGRGTLPLGRRLVVRHGDLLVHS